MPLKHVAAAVAIISGPALTLLAGLGIYGVIPLEPYALSLAPIAVPLGLVTLVQGIAVLRDERQVKNRKPGYSKG